MNTINVRIGFLTTPEGEQTFREVLNEFGNIDGRLLIYHSDDEIRELIESLRREIDVLIFGGPLSYHLYRKYVNDNVPTLSIDYRETELMSGLLALLNERKLPVGALSLDTFTVELVNEVLKETGIAGGVRTYVKPFDAAESHDSIVRFHRELWESGSIDHVLTCRRSVFEALSAAGVPVTKILPSKFNVRNSIAKAILLGENIKNANFQIAIGHFLVIPDAAGQGSDYAQEKLSLDFHRILVDLAQRFNASIMPLGMFEFLMYTSRGFLEEVTRLWTESSVFRNAERKLSARVYAGFGAGKTPLAAQVHAKSALERAKERREGCAFLIRDDGKIIGPLGAKEALEYTHRATDPLLQEMAARTHLSADTVAKVLSFSRIHGSFTAEELANALGVTTRNVRNIFRKLADAGYLEETGMERPYPKGRPRKIFAIRRPE